MSSSHCSSVCNLNENWCNTEIQLHEAKYFWIIDNFDFHEAVGKDLRSPTFSAATNHQVKWFLKVKPNGSTRGPSFAKDTISFYVYLSPESEPKRIFAKYNVSALNSQQEACQTRCYTYDGQVHEYSFETSMSSHWGRKEFLKKTAEIRNTILANNKLTITCTITFSLTNDAFRVNNTCRALQLYPEVPSCNIVEKLGMFLENHDFADIVFCVKGKEYPAHKLILAAQSPVFAAMFKHNLKENETNRIEIEDMNEEVVAEMLRFIYTGKCENCEKLADGLLAAADKYDLGRLKMICAEALYKALSIDNAANILALADLHRVEKLKSEVIKFIVVRFSAVLNTTAWKNLLLSHPEVINEVCRAVAGRLASPNEDM